MIVLRAPTQLGAHKLFGQVSSILCRFGLWVSARPPLDHSGPSHHSEVGRNRENPWIWMPEGRLLGKSKNVENFEMIVLGVL